MAEGMEEEAVKVEVGVKEAVVDEAEVDLEVAETVGTAGEG